MKRPLLIFGTGISVFQCGFEGRLKAIHFDDSGSGVQRVGIGPNLEEIDLPAELVLSGAIPKTGLIMKVQTNAGSTVGVSRYFDLPVLKTTVVYVESGNNWSIEFETNS